jgi:hypothetical protein
MRFFAVLCAAGTLCAGQEVPSQTLLLARIREHMLDQLRRQPNYTCTETVERSGRDGARKKLKDIDTVRFEVALVDGKEMFAWPGARKFESTDVSEMVKGGAIGNGDFAMHARAIFTNAGATFEYMGEQDGLVRYDFHIPVLVSGYRIRVADERALVGYHGSIAADPKTLDVLHLEVIAENIPRNLGVASASDRMDYARVNIGASNFLLPAESEMTMVDLDGHEHLNRTRFASCRAFTGESVVKFDGSESAAPVAIENLRIPEDHLLQLALEEDLDTGTAAIGDPIRARLQNDVKEGGRILFAKGATVLGRITRLERHSDYTTLGLRFSEIDTEHARGEFKGSLEWVAMTERAAHVSHSDSGDGILTLRSSRAHLNRGILMFWRTRKP